MSQTLVVNDNMLSYQHHFHVGNHADVLKHWILFETVRYIQQKAKPFDYIDTHAGAGLYSLLEQKSQKLKEFEQGISRLMASPVGGMEQFIEFMHPYIKQDQYPGSCFLVSQMLRSTDRSWLYELHPQTFAELTNQRLNQRQCFIRQEDGFKALLGLLPNQSKRAVVLIDPAYELKEDYQKVISVSEQAITRMANTVILIWYPVVSRQNIEQMEQRIKNSRLRNVQRFELSVLPDTEERGMTGSGMIAINPPWTLKKLAEKTLPNLASTLAMVEGASYRVDTLVEE